MSRGVISKYHWRGKVGIFKKKNLKSSIIHTMIQCTYKDVVLESFISYCHFPVETMTYYVFSQTS